MYKELVVSKEPACVMLRGSSDARVELVQPLVLPRWSRFDGEDVGSEKHWQRKGRSEKEDNTEQMLTEGGGAEGAKECKANAARPAPQ